MASVIAEAARKLNLQPGDKLSEIVDGHTIEIRSLKGEEVVSPEYADWEMVDLCLNIPKDISPSFKVIGRVVREPDLPKPFVIDESDLAPE